MVEQVKWIERKFKFDFKVGMYPNLVERLRGVPARLEELSGELSHEELIMQIEGRWSIQEEVGHLLTLDDLHISRLDQFIAGEENLVAADMSNAATNAAEFNEIEIADILRDFREKRMRFVNRLDEVNEETAARSAFHPRLKKQMRLVDMVYFTAEHDDHHIVKISWIRRRLKE